jgi:CPA1 family monovalent cation:H+ antiporter
MPESLTWFAASATIALVVAAITRQLGWGMALPLVGVGAVVGAVPIGPNAPLEPEFVLITILAPLVFGEALGSSYLDIRRVSRPVLVLAVGLVIVTTFVVGGAVAIVVGMPLALGLALGAVLAPTDAVAVGTIARKAGLPGRVVSILEGESLVNDGTGLTALRVALVAALAGTITIGQIGLVFIAAVAGGLAVGLVGGWGLSQVLARSRDVVAANGIVLIAPFVLYLVTERIGGSGILAVVVAALFTAHSQFSDVRQSGRLQSGTVWRHVTFILQALAFFLVGLEIPDTFRRFTPGTGGLVFVLVLIVVALLIVTRIAFTLGTFRIGKMRRAGSEQGMRLAFLVGWAGARGPVSGLAAVSIPLTLDDGSPLPYRDVILATTFGVILVTLVLAQSLGPLARWMRITPDDEKATVQRVNAALAHAALQQLEQVEKRASMAGRPIPREIVTQLTGQVQARLAAAHEAQAPDTGGSVRATLDLALLMVRAEQEELIRMRDEDGLPDSIVRPILRALDVRAQALATQGHA